VARPAQLLVHNRPRLPAEARSQREYGTSKWFTVNGEVRTMDLNEFGKKLQAFGGAVTLLVLSGACLLLTVLCLMSLLGG